MINTTLLLLSGLLLLAFNNCGGKSGDGDPPPTASIYGRWKADHPNGSTLEFSREGATYVMKEYLPSGQGNCVCIGPIPDSETGGAFELASCSSLFAPGSLHCDIHRGKFTYTTTATTISICKEQSQQCITRILQ